MFHGNGWGLPFSAALTGADLVLPGPKVDPESLLDLITSEGVTFSAGVPTIWLELAKALEANPGRWRLRAPLSLVAGGATPPSALFDRLKQHDIDLRQVWGMTETASAITISAPDKQTAVPAAPTQDQSWRRRQGKPMAIVDIRIAEGERVLPMDGMSSGEVQVRGACVTDFYFNQDLPERWTSDGWLRTGDIGALDPHGNLQLFDRTEDMIKSGGEWIIPADLEHAMSEYPGISECTVVAVPHPKWGERPLAILVLRQDARFDEDGLRQHLLRHFAKWQIPDAFIIRDAIPRTAVGKVARRDLRAQYAGYMETS
jgi:fatty-acyl-CoA synthase